MAAELQSHIAFHLTGRRSAGGLDPIAGQDMRPALMAHYRDLASLRHDFPVVLVDNAAPQACVQSLSAVIDTVAATLEDEPEHERTTLHLRRLESEIRAAVLRGESGTLGALWDAAATRLTAAGDDQALADSLQRGHAALAVDGELVDCDGELAQRFVTHVWRSVEAARARRFRAEVGGLIARLSDILRADFALSPAGRSAENLRAGMANAFSTELDFDALSGLLSRVSAKAPAPEARLRRVREVLEVLEAQRFVSFEGLAAPGKQPSVHGFLFDSAAEALEAYRARLPEIVTLVRAMSIARLELRSDYVAERHDSFFRDFGAQMLGEEELALFPGYLVRVSAADLHAGASAELMELLGAGLPVKFLVQIDDILEPSPIADGRVAFRSGTTQLAKMALGLNDVYVMQAAGSHLLAVREQLVAGLSGFGPGLLSVFSGASSNYDGLSPYLVGAAAIESRAFPVFWYDPSAGADWASRFSLGVNPQTEADWATHALRYEDAGHQRATARLAFTLIDFAACDSRYSAHFARLPAGQSDSDLVEADAALDTGDAAGVPSTVPYIRMVDANNLMHRVVVDQKMMLAARRCLDQWRSLQELGGIHNSYAQALLERERAAWEGALEAVTAAKSTGAQAAAAADAEAAPTTGAPPAPAATPSASAEAEPERAPGEAYIETPRCSSCDECTTINKKMFAYDANRQAYIADVKAGTFRQLVEAAEGCQLSIIHPGAPINPDEPGIEELIERAAPFQ
jgi:hypothetical protein